MAHHAGASYQVGASSASAGGTAHSFVVPGRFHPGWSLLGRGLGRLTGDRLRAETLHVVLVTGGALAWLMGIYATEMLSELLPVAPLVLWGGLGGAGLLLVLVGALGFRPPAVVVCGAEAVRIGRGREQMRLPYAALVRAEVVAPRTYHRHYRRYAAVRPFLDAPGTPVLLLHAQDGAVAALGLSEDDRAALRRCIAARKQQNGKAEERESERAVEYEP